MSSKRSFQNVVVARASAGSFCAAQELGVHAHDQHLLVVRAVEDADAPALGQALAGAPQEVVVELLRARAP